MKQDKFEHIVKESLESLEPEVPAHLWENIRGQIPTPQPAPTSSGQSAGTTGAGSAGGASLIKIGAAALVVLGGGFIVWQLNTGGPTADVVATNENTEVANPIEPKDNKVKQVEPVTIQSEATEASEKRKDVVSEAPTQTNEQVTDVSEEPASEVTESEAKNPEETADSPGVSEDSNAAKNTQTKQGSPDRTGSDESVQEPQQQSSQPTNELAADEETAESETTIEESTEESQLFVEAGVLASAVKGEAPLEVEFSNITEASSYEWNFGNGKYSSEKAPSVEFEEPGEYTVRLTVTNPDGNRMTDQMDISVYGLFLPNIFTPNGDGINDTYLIQGTNVTNVSFSIYRLDGSLVFEGRGMNAEWDGNDSREPHAENYLVIATATLQDGSEVVKKETLTVRRN